MTGSPARRGPLARLAGDRQGLDRTLFLLAGGMVTFSFSNAAQAVLHGLAWILFAMVMVRHRRWLVPGPRRWALPWIAFAGWTLLAAALSTDPAYALLKSKKLLNLLAVFLFIAMLRTAREYGRILATTCGILAIQCLIALYTFATTADHVSDRAKGTLSHHMTFSGMVLIATCLVVALLTFRKDRLDLYWWGFAGLAAVALLASLTRSAWIALALGIAIVLAFKNPKWLAALPVALALLLLVPGIRERVQSMWDTRGDYSNVQRLAMYPTGLRMIAAHPFLGVGSVRAVQEAYPEFEGTPPAPPPAYPGGPPQDPYEVPDHLHNNVLQIAAMSGVPALLAWLAALGVYYAQVWRVLPARRDVRDEDGRLRRNLILGSLAAVTAFLAMGMLEYNFGDTEVSILFFFALSIPFALERTDRPPLLADRRGAPA